MQSRRVIEYFGYLNWDIDWREGSPVTCWQALPYAATTNTFPYYFVADEAFPLKPHLMHPYT
jgi:hypothetical protein